MSTKQKPTIVIARLTQDRRMYRAFVVLMLSILLVGSHVAEANELKSLEGPIFDAHVDDAWGCCISPDGENVYITSAWRDGALVAFRRDPETGQLEHIQTLKDNEDGRDGLAGPYGITMSNEGRFIYVAGEADDAVCVFSRDASTGLLSFIEVIKGGVLWNGLNGCYDVALSPDGSNLYAVGRWDDTLVVFSVDSSTGELAFVEVHRNGFNGLYGFNRPRRLAVSPDGGQVFVSARDTDTLFIFNRNPNTGTLTLAKSWENGMDGLSILQNPSQIIFSADGLNAYVGSQARGFIVLSRNSSTGQWSVLEEHNRGVAPDYDLWGTRYLALSPDQTRLYVSSDGSCAVTVYRRDLLTGQVSRASQVLRWRGIQNFGYLHQIAISPDGIHAYLATGEDALHCFNLRSEQGEISHNSVAFGGPSNLQGLGSITRLCVSLDGLNVYCPSYDEGGIITTFERDPETGILFPVHMIGHCEDYHASQGLTNIEEVIVASNNRDVYGVSTHDNAIAHFYRDVQDGHLLFQAAYFNNSGIENMLYPYSIALSPDNRHLYATGLNSDSVISFEVQDDGTLVFLESIVNGTGELDRLNGPTKMSLSPDGDHLYVITEENDAIVIFSRERQTGFLTYKGFVSDDLYGVRGLNGPRCIQISPDGKHVYIAARHESTIACFEREQYSGMLNFIEAVPAGFYHAGRSMAFNGIGTRLYVPSYGSDSVVAFHRNPRTGLLQPVDTASKLDGMNGPNYVAISPDDRHLYLSCWLDDCICTFSLNSENQR